MLQQRSEARQAWLGDKGIRYAKRLLAVVGAIAFLALVLRIAWVCDDGYITFRTLEQVMAGHGLRWNPHERVQVFTSPLWFFLLLLPRLVSPHVFLNALGVALVVDAALLVVLYAWARRDGGVYFVLLLLLVASKGFFDYTTAGLESPLAYALLAWFAWQVRAWAEARTPRSKRAFQVLAVGGLVVLTRYDLALMVLPAAVWVWWRTHSRASWWFHFRSWVVAFSPVLAWALFALFYYGTPFPNTAYAKMPPGYPRWALLKDGVKYFVALGMWDTASLVLLGGGLGLAAWAAWQLWRHREVRDRAEVVVPGLLGAGMVLHLAYIGWVGGDFMAGRFAAFDVLWAVMLVVWWASRQPTWRPLLVLAAVGALYVVFYPNTALNSPLPYTNPRMWKGISDERGFYEEASLFMYLHGHFATSGRPFPPTDWTEEGLKFRQGPHTVIVASNIGYFGYWAGTDKIIVDRYALADPFLARLPAQFPSRIGHFRRLVPAGYVATLETGQLHIQDPDLRAYYRQLALVTQGPLWSWERLKAIFCLNVGCYHHYLSAWEARQAR